MLRHCSKLYALLILAGICPVGVAQNALGDGRALDNSLSTRGRFNQARPSLVSEFAFRNSVVTGNAPGGMSFRGDIGYRAPGEFGGELGSNDLFAYRRDSLRSGMAGMGIRGTEALQYQLALTTGNRPPANLVGRFTVSRSGTTPSAGSIGGLTDPGSGAGLRQRPSIDPEADTRGTMLWMLRSPSAYISNSSLQTSALRLVRGGESDVYTLTASPLRGVRLSPVPELSVPRKQGEEQEGDAGTPPGDSEFGAPKAPVVRTMHDNILKRLTDQDERANAEDVFSTGPTISDRVRDLLGQLGSTARREVDGSEDPDDDSRDGSGATSAIRFDPETMRLLRGDGTPLSEYVNAAGADRDVYAEHLSAGQDLMARGRYFDAEERFAHALGIRRGDVTAQVARLHAQIGAGLLLSASLNMQSIAMIRPEVLAAKYGEEMLPSPERLENLIIIFRETLDNESERSKNASRQIRQSSGLLLGYIGYQLGRKDLIREGLGDFRRRVSAGLEPGAPLSIEAKLGEMLHAMWIVPEMPDENGDD